MKNFLQKALALILIFALTLLSGCAKDNSHLSGSAAYSSSLLSSAITESGLIGSDEDDFLNSFEGELLSSDNTSLISSDFLGGSDLATSYTSSNFVSSATLTSSVNSVISTTLGKGSSQSSSTPTNAGTNGSAANEFLKGLWVCYYELPFWGKSESKAKEDFLKMMQLAANQGYNAVFCHVRANADAFYPSKYFPFAMQLTGKAGKDPGYDPLKIMIWAAKKCGLEFHAWINPYRVSNTGTNPSNLAAGHIAATWLADGSERAVTYESGIYFNPASTDVQKLILNGIREILDNYSVDGIHFDDYFYPGGINKNFDEKHYSEYLKSNANPLSLEDWRRANVNALVSAVYRLCHSKNTVFGISPAGNMSLDNSHDNYNELFIDIALWMAEEGYVDYILPQIYFGYNHPVKKAQYTYLLNIWASLPKHKNLKLFVGLGAYRMNADCEDKAEWHNEADLMARQATDAIKRGANGIAVFSYKATSLDNEHNNLQIKNMFNAINSFS